MNQLTIEVDAKVIELAKQLAIDNNTTISSLFENFILALSQRRTTIGKIGPLTQQATGILKVPPGMTDQELIEEALLEKYGMK